MFFYGALMNAQKIIDLTHVVTPQISVSPYDEPIKLEQYRNLETHKNNDWRLISGMHVGTHIDGPGHLTESKKLLSDYPVDRFVGTGFLIDARDKKIDVILLAQVPDQENLIVLVLTGQDKKFGSKEYFTNYPVFEPDFAQALVDHKVKMVGIDSFSPDTYPFSIHHLFFEHDILIIENLTNLDQLSGIKKFKVIALPLKLETDSAPARVIALV